MTLVDIGAGTGAFAAAFCDWFDLSVLAVEPSAAMRDQIPRTPAIQVLEGNASALPLPDESADAAWLSLVIHHIPDLESPHTRSAAFSAPVPPSSSDRASRADWTGSNSSDGSLRPLGRSIPTLPSKIRARRSRPQDSTRTLLSRFVRRTRPASRTSSARWTRSARPTPRCATSLRRSSSAAKNVSAVPYDMPRTQRTRKPEATGLTSWFCADRFARKANLDVLPSQAPAAQHAQLQDTRRTRSTGQDQEGSLTESSALSVKTGQPQSRPAGPRCGSTGEAFSNGCPARGCYT
jgi:Methyltransferase domain